MSNPGDISKLQVQLIREDLDDFSNEKVKNDETLYNKLADVQEHVMTRFMTTKRDFTLLLKNGVNDYPFDDRIVAVNKFEYDPDYNLHPYIVNAGIYVFSESVVITGDTLNQLSNCIIHNAGYNNTDNGVLYWAIKGNMFYVYKLSSGIPSSVVLQADISFIVPGSPPALILLSEVNNSGLTGQITVTGKTDELDVANQKLTFSITIARRTLRIPAGISFNDGDKIIMHTYIKSLPLERISDSIDPVIEPDYYPHLRAMVLCEYRRFNKEFKEKILVEADIEKLVSELNIDDRATPLKLLNQTFTW